MTGEPGPERHPEPAPPAAGMTKLIDGLYRYQGRVFAVAAAVVIIMTLVYRM